MPTAPDQGPTSADVLLYGDELKSGAQVGSYVIDRRHARGGFATIYRAAHHRLRRPAAIKVLRPDFAHDPNMLRRFEQEALAVNAIHHPNIVDIHEIGQLTDGRPYLIMEWLAGESLKQRLADSGPLTMAEAEAVLETLARALSAAHAMGIIHRDVKPSNVMLAIDHDDVTVKLLDFGIAKLLEPRSWNVRIHTTTGLRIGTPGYMAPEQIRGTAVDARTDVYALGALLYEMVAGRPPFVADTEENLHQMHLEAPPPMASEMAPVDSALDAIIVRCLQKDALDRYDSAAAVVIAASAVMRAGARVR